MADAVQFAEVDSALRRDGFEPRPPSAEVAAQDEGTCRRLSCARCRTPGLAYRPYLRPGSSGTRYRALAVCLACDAAVEF